VSYSDWIRLDSNAERPLFQQLYEALKLAVKEKRLKPGTLLPPSRNLADDLGLSRTTVVAAYKQLTAEGYTLTRQGSGTRVLDSIPTGRSGGNKTLPQRLSRAGESFCRLMQEANRFDYHAPAFCPALPALDHFPRESWARIAGRIWRRCDDELFEYGSSQGYRPLREAIAAHLADARGLVTSPEHIIITNGAQQALDLCARVLVDRGELVCLENPGYFGSRAAFGSIGAELAYCPVDDQGLVPNLQLKPRLICLSPNHQFPLGVTMPLGRRLDLLQWAAQSESWVIEDDYDSELRYSTRPLEPLLSLQQEGRVLYLGSFSKIMFPSLRLGFMIVPDSLIEPFMGARLATDRQLPIHDQAVLATFMKEGLYSRHLWRMREVYEERRQAMVKALRPGLELGSAEGGFHLVVWLPEDQDDGDMAVLCAQAGLEANAISFYNFGRSHRPGLLLGFGGVTPEEVPAAAERLLRVVGEG
jgi:GntR family transcriptional regulator / MocR family aminotransferase